MSDPLVRCQKCQWHSLWSDLGIKSGTDRRAQCPNCLELGEFIIAPSPDAGTGTPDDESFKPFFDRAEQSSTYWRKLYTLTQEALAAAMADKELLEWQNKERLTVTWNDRHGAFIVQGQHQVCGNMGRGKTVIEALRAARAAKSEGGEDRKPA